jgi:glycosyltransferase involved in cell wall biosynthesis
MKTVLQIMDYAAPYKGNFIPSIENLDEHLCKSGNRLIYLFPAVTKELVWAKELEYEGKKIYYIDRSFFSKKVKIRNIKFILKLIKNENVNVINTHFVANNYSLAIIKCFFLHNVKVVGNFLNEFCPPFNRYRKIKIFITKITFDLIIGCSPSVAKSITITGISPNKVICVNNALDIKHLQEYKEISIIDYPGQKVVLMFGWPYSRKGVDFGIEAIRILNAEGGNYLLAIELPGPPSLIENEILSKLGIMPPWIKFLEPRNDVASYFNASDVFLSASREEGLAYSVLEAAYCNCMIIVSDIGGHARDIPYTAVYKVEDIEKLKKSIKEMCNQSPEQRILINNAQRQYVIKKYDLNNWSESVINCYLE